MRVIELLVILAFIGIIWSTVMVVPKVVEKFDNGDRITELEAKIAEQQIKIDRYEYIIADMMQGQWKPGMGILKEFKEELYGTEIWTFKAVNRPPGSPAVDIGEILDRHIEK